MVRKKNKPAGSAKPGRHDDMPVIGWREWLALPALGIEPVKAKIDTGARTSSLHAFDLRTFTRRGVRHIAFVVHPVQHRRRPAIECSAEVSDARMVTSSSGHRELRYVIRTEVELCGIVWPIELTLANRDAMGFRMLLGREAVRDRFLIDPGRSYIAGRSHADVSYVSLKKVT